MLHLFRLKPRQDWNSPSEGLFFIFLMAGAGEFLDDSSAPPAVQLLARGDVLVLRAGVGGKVRAAGESELAFCAFSVSVEHLFPLFVAEQLSLVQTLMDSFKTARYYPATQSATVGWHQLIRELPAEFNLEHRSQLLHVAGAILAEEFQKLQPSLSRYERADARVTRVFEQMSVEQILSLSREELAGRFGCSQRHLNRIFKEHFGLSLGALRMEMRLLKVVSLLRNPDAKIITLAQQCGFNHRGLFNACFKRRFGVSPGQWRKNGGRNQLPAPALAATNLGGQFRGKVLFSGSHPAVSPRSDAENQKSEVISERPPAKAVGSRPLVASGESVSRA